MNCFRILSDKPYRLTPDAKFWSAAISPLGQSPKVRSEYVRSDGGGILNLVSPWMLDLSTMHLPCVDDTAMTAQLWSFEGSADAFAPGAVFVLAEG